MNFTYLKMDLGSIDNPQILTEKEIKVLVYIYEHQIDHSLSGYISTESGYISAYHKFALESLGLVVLIDNSHIETSDYSLVASKTLINEGESVQIKTNGVTAATLKWYIKNIAISGVSGVLATTIKNRISLSQQGVLSCDKPEENSSWAATVTIATYPFYLSNPSEISAQEKTTTVNIQGIAAKEIVITLDNPQLSEGESTVLSAEVLPTTCTKTVDKIEFSAEYGSILGFTYTAPTSRNTDTIRAEGLVMGDYITGYYQLAMSVAAVSPTSNPVLWNALLSAYPDRFGNEGRNSIKSEELAVIQDVTDLLAILKASTVGFTFDEFRYFTAITKMPNPTDEGGCLAGSLIESIVFPDSIDEVGGEEHYFTFSGTEKQYLLMGDFAGCQQLHSVDFGKGVLTVSGSLNQDGSDQYKGNLSYIASGAFAMCPRLVNINFGNVRTISSGRSTISTGGARYLIDGAFAKCTTLTKVSSTTIRTLTVENTTTGHKDNYLGAFSDCTRLSTFDLPALRTIVTPDSFTSPFRNTALSDTSKFALTQIGVRSFQYADNLNVLDLTNCTIPTFNLTFDHYGLDNSRNNNMPLTTIIMPKGKMILNTPTYWCRRTEIDTLDFATNGTEVTKITSVMCSGTDRILSHLYFPQRTIPSLSKGNYLWDNATQHIERVFVPDDLVDAYKASTGWNEYVELGGEILPASDMSKYGFEV